MKLIVNIRLDATPQERKRLGYACIASAGFFVLLFLLFAFFDFTPGDHSHDGSSGEIELFGGVIYWAKALINAFVWFMLDLVVVFAVWNGLRFSWGRFFAGSFLSWGFVYVRMQTTSGYAGKSFFDLEVVIFAVFIFAVSFLLSALIAGIRVLARFVRTKASSV